MSSANKQRRRVILLGASNVTRGISTIVQTAQSAWGRPLDVMAAIGHGRSYGITSSFLGRELPGILECGLWDALCRLPRAETAALLTDIGNDLMFEVPPSEVAGWVEEALNRLAGLDAKTAIALLPVANIRSLGPRRYGLFRQLFFPRCSLSLEEISQRALELNDLVSDLAIKRGIPLVEPPAAWYGFDPIHVKRRHWSTAWAEICSPWCVDGQLLERAVARPLQWAYLRLRMPASYRRFGAPRWRNQPSGMLRDGTTISLY